MTRRQSHVPLAQPQHAALLASSSWRWRYNLPPQPTTLVGREGERAAVSVCLLQPEVRLLTLTGPGGTGKTRLAIAVAGDVLEAFGGDVCWVDLAPVDRPDRVVPSIAQTLGVYETGGLPAEEGLQRALHERVMLLVLDNFEHVLPAAGELAGLLEACPRTKILVTSREPLLLRWEREVPVAPLGLPTPDQAHDPALAMQAAAIALFVERAQDLDPRFQLTTQNVAAVAELCSRLDGLPLAIELAAVRLRVLPPSALLARLGQRLDLLRQEGQDVPARHRTLTAAIGWSYGMLAPEEQALFRLLGVFVGGATVEALEAMAEDSQVLLECLSALVEKSLVQRVADPNLAPAHRPSTRPCWRALLAPRPANSYVLAVDRSHQPPGPPRVRLQRRRQVPSPPCSAARVAGILRSTARGPHRPLGLWPAGVRAARAPAPAAWPRPASRSAS